MIMVQLILSEEQVRQLRRAEDAAMVEFVDPEGNVVGGYVDKQTHEMVARILANRGKPATTLRTTEEVLAHLRSLE